MYRWKNTIFLAHLSSEPAELAGGFAAPAKVRLVPEVLLKVRDSLATTTATSVYPSLRNVWGRGDRAWPSAALFRPF